MEFALVAGVRTAPTPGLRGACPLCGSAVVAKCGAVRLHHWSHLVDRNCDPWWENETQWHRDWKSHFPTEWHEVIAFDGAGEKHIADVKTSRGTVLEFKNSPMSETERTAREHFYGRMIWVVNAQPFAGTLEVLAQLPHPRSALAKDLVISVPSGSSTMPTYWRRSEHPDRRENDLVRIRSWDSIAVAVRDTYRGHHALRWKRPRAVWLNASCPVLFDVGMGVLLQLVHGHPSVGTCVRRIEKDAFVRANGGALKSRDREGSR